MIKKCAFRGFGRFGSPLQVDALGALNVFLGVNDSGKTYLLKALYAVARALEEWHRSPKNLNPESVRKAVEDKIRWVFLPSEQELRLGSLVTRGEEEAKVDVAWAHGGSLSMAWGNLAKHKLARMEVAGEQVFQGKTVTFIPPKEVLGLFPAIRQTEDYGLFDATYVDLMRDFEKAVPRGRLQNPVYEALDRLRETVGGGEVEVDKEGVVSWKRSGKLFAIAQTAEGIRKAGILFQLLRNRRINPKAGGLLFVDEPEANLHPRAEVLFAELLHHLANAGIQVFVATHSYFVAKRLEQLSRQDSKADHYVFDLRVESELEVSVRYGALAEGLPEGNPIIQQSLELFAQDVALDLDNEPRPPLR